MNLLSIYKLGCKLLDVLEVIHNAGYVHNDLSLERIVLGHDQKLKPNIAFDTDDCFENVDLHLVDFTFMTPYVDERTGEHLKKEKVKELFNVKNDFQSLNRLSSIRSGRKDDLEMLANILLYLRNNYELPCLDFP